MLMATLGKPQRQHRIARLLEEQAVSSQAQLVELLAADGVVATQATVSRDLEELGAVKVRIPGGTMAYAIPEHAKERTRARRPPPPGDGRVRGRGRAQRATSSCCARRRDRPTWSARRSTGPGSPDVLGTVAGDDTIILVCAEAGGRRRRVGRPTSPAARRRSRDREGAVDAMTKRVVLAYSGGLDTSVAVQVDPRGVGRRGRRARGRRRPAGRRPWDDDPRSARSRPARSRPRWSTPAPSSPTTSSCPRIHANALYEGKYPLVRRCRARSSPSTSCAAARESAPTPSRHGCTGKGNDQVRFEVSVRAPRARPRRARAGARVGLHPRRLRSTTPAKHEIPISVTKEKPVLDRREHVGPGHRVRRASRTRGSSPPDEPYTLTRDVADAPREPREIVVGFERACRSRSTASRCRCTSSIDELGAAVGAYGWGRLDMVENRRVGIKSREIYECPASLALILAHADLESITLERDVMREKARLEPRTPSWSTTACGSRRCKEALDAFIGDDPAHVTGEVRLRLEPGRCFVAGRRADRGPLRLRPRDLRRRRHVPPRGLRRLRAPVGPVGRDVVAPPGPGSRA